MLTLSSTFSATHFEPRAFSSSLRGLILRATFSKQVFGTGINKQGFTMSTRIIISHSIFIYNIQSTTINFSFPTGPSDPFLSSFLSVAWPGSFKEFILSDCIHMLLWTTIGLFVNSKTNIWKTNLPFFNTYFIHSCESKICDVCI